MSRPLLRVHGRDRCGAYGGTAPPAPPPPVTPRVPIDLGTWDIRAYCRLSGDHYYSIPDGYYYGGDLTNAPHAATAGIYKGYLILEATTPGGVIIDQGPVGKVLPNGQTANGNLNIVGDGISGNSSGIIFSGCKFANGFTLISARNIHFWYPEVTFPASVWAAEAGRSSNTSYHNTNGTIKLGSGAVNNRIYGGNFHDLGYAFWPGPGCRFFYCSGSKFIRCDDGGSSVDVTDNIHPDVISIIQGNVWHLWITDCFIQGGGSETGIAIYDFAYGASEDLNFARIWVNNCYGEGINITSIRSPFTLGGGAPGGGDHIFGMFTDVHSWGNGTVWGVPHSAQYNQRVDDTDGITNTIGSNPQPSRINFPATTSDTAVAQVGTDPATAWQAVVGQRYQDLVTFFGTLSWAMS